MTLIQPTTSFRDNLALLPSVEGVARIDLVDVDGTIVASIPNESGKQGSLAVYQYLKLSFGQLDAAAAEHGLMVFGEHTPDATARPGAHPNIDRLLGIASGGATLKIVSVAQ